MPVSDAQKKANKKYFEKNYKQVKLSMPIDEAEKLEFFCELTGHTKAGFIRKAIDEKMSPNKMEESIKFNEKALKIMKEEYAREQDIEKRKIQKMDIEEREMKIATLKEKYTKYILYLNTYHGMNYKLNDDNGGHS